MQTYSVELAKNSGAGNGTPQSWSGGHGVIAVEATFGGGSVALQFVGPNGAWLPVLDAITGVAISLTAAGSARFFLPPGSIRIVATTATAVYAIAARVPA